MPYTAKYIATTDITDSIARRYISGSDARLDTWMTNTDLEIESIAQEHGLSTESITVPIHYKVKEYAIAYYCYLIFQDVFGSNEVENPEQEIHKMKLEYCLSKCNALRQMITKEMLSVTSSSLSAHERIHGGQIWI
jgi:L-ribulose-5-phosphate 3-epimerase UlaE